MPGEASPCPCPNYTSLPSESNRMPRRVAADGVEEDVSEVGRRCAVAENRENSSQAAIASWANDTGAFPASTPC